MQELLVTTVDIARPYTIIGQVSCYATSTLFSPYSLKKLFKKYKSELQPIYEQQRHLLPEATEEALFAEQICTHKGEMAGVAIRSCLWNCVKRLVGWVQMLWLEFVFPLSQNL